MSPLNQPNLEINLLICWNDVEVDYVRDYRRCSSETKDNAFEPSPNHNVRRPVMWLVRRRLVRFERHFGRKIKVGFDVWARKASSISGRDFLISGNWKKSFIYRPKKEEEW